MSAQETQSAARRREHLRAVADGYFEALWRQDFSSISPETLCPPTDTSHGPLPQKKPCVVPQVLLYFVLHYRETTMLAAPPHSH